MPCRDLPPEYQDLAGDEDVKLIRDFVSWANARNYRWPGSEEDFATFCEKGLDLCRRITDSRKFQELRPKFSFGNDGIDKVAADQWHEDWIDWLLLAQDMVTQQPVARTVSLLRRAVCRLAFEVLSSDFVPDYRVNAHNALVSMRAYQDDVSNLITARIELLEGKG